MNRCRLVIFFRVQTIPKGSEEFWHLPRHTWEHRCAENSWTTNPTFPVFYCNGGIFDCRSGKDVVNPGRIHKNVNESQAVATFHSQVLKMSWFCDLQCKSCDAIMSVFSGWRCIMGCGFNCCIKHTHGNKLSEYIIKICIPCIVFTVIVEITI